MPLAAAIPSIIGIGGSLLGGIFGSKAADKAASQQATAYNNAYNLNMNATNNALGANTSAIQNSLDAENQWLAPYLNLGTQSASTLADALKPGGSLTSQFSFDPSKVADTPEYQFQLQQGTEAVQNSAAAKGGLFGGNTLRGLTQYSQGLASTAYQQAYNNALNTFQTNRNNTLGALGLGAGLGQTANSQLQGALGQYQQGTLASNAQYQSGVLNSTNDLVGVGNAQARGTIGSNNAWQSAIGGVTGGLQTLSGLIPGAQPGIGPGSDMGNLPGSGMETPGYSMPAPGMPVAPPSMGNYYSDTPMPAPTLPQAPGLTNVQPSANAASPQAAYYNQTLAALRGVAA